MKWRKIETAVLCLVHRYHLFIGVGINCLLLHLGHDNGKIQPNKKEQHWQWQKNNTLSYSERECIFCACFWTNIFKKNGCYLICFKLYFFLTRNLNQHLIFWDRNKNIFLSILWFETRMGIFVYKSCVSKREREIEMISQGQARKHEANSRENFWEREFLSC